MGPAPAAVDERVHFGRVRSSIYTDTFDEDRDEWRWTNPPHDWMRDLDHSWDRATSQLAPAFVEWMMAFQPGWTDGMSRTQALKALGNAVVWPQAVAAIRELTP